MNRTPIEWAKNPDGTPGYTSNPMKGYCPMACSYCYARQLYDRFGWDKTIRMDKKEIDAIVKRKKPAGIFVGSMFELFLDRYEPWMQYIMFQLEKCPQHRFYLLTKQPQNLIKFSPFPENCRVGVTATGYKAFNEALDYLKGIEAKGKYLSLEPLLERIPFYPERLEYCGIDQVIIGAQTKPYKPPEIAWVQEIVRRTHAAGIAVFLKDNLEPLLSVDVRNANSIFYDESEPMSPILRQELPK